jgi:hypothetical protein
MPVSVMAGLDPLNPSANDRHQVSTIGEQRRCRESPSIKHDPVVRLTLNVDRYTINEW